MLEGDRGKRLHGLPLLLDSGIGLDEIGWPNFMRVWSDLRASGYGPSRCHSFVWDNLNEILSNINVTAVMFAPDD